MRDLIFGMTWEELDAKQRGRGLPRVVDLTADPDADLMRHEEADAAILAQYGTLQAIEDAQLHGVADRIKRRAARKIA